MDPWDERYSWYSYMHEWLIVYGKLVGKYTSPMHGMGITQIGSSFRAGVKIDENSNEMKPLDPLAGTAAKRETTEGKMANNPMQEDAQEFHEQFYI